MIVSLLSFAKGIQGSKTVKNYLKDYVSMFQ
jgi:hypothetical protein